MLHKNAYYNLIIYGRDCCSFCQDLLDHIAFDTQFYHKNNFWEGQVQDNQDKVLDDIRERMSEGR
jgi:hypothetical protein